jgi:hypothetical protein
MNEIAFFNAYQMTYQDMLPHIDARPGQRHTGDLRLHTSLPILGDLERGRRRTDEVSTPRRQHEAFIPSNREAEPTGKPQKLDMQFILKAMPRAAGIRVQVIRFLLAVSPCVPGVSQISAQTPECCAPAGRLSRCQVGVETLHN